MFRHPFFGGAPVLGSKSGGLEVRSSNVLTAFNSLSPVRNPSFSSLTMLSSVPKASYIIIIEMRLMARPAVFTDFAFAWESFGLWVCEMGGVI